MFLKKALRPIEKRKLVIGIVEEYKLSLRRACALFTLSTSVFRYKTKVHTNDDRLHGLIRQTIRESSKVGLLEAIPLAT